jgi:hypothetical protein
MLVVPKQSQRKVDESKVDESMLTAPRSAVRNCILYLRGDEVRLSRDCCQGRGIATFLGLKWRVFMFASTFIFASLS